LEKIADPEELGKVPVEGTGGRLRLSDVANIVVDHQPLIGDAVVAGGAGLVLVIEKFPGTSTLEVNEGVEEALEKLRPGLLGVHTDTSIFQPARYIESAIGNLGLALAVGGLLMLLVLLALRFHWRPAVIAIVTVPSSLVAAAMLLRLLGEGFNAIALAGLAAGVAVVVDEAVAPTERVARRLRQAKKSGGSVPLSSVVSEAFAEARRPLTYATLIILLAVVPVAVLGGRPGAFMAPLVLAYVLAVAAAMLVAVTVTPILTVLAFARWQPARNESRMPQRVRAS
jgi:Cu/Ag efflux pump CusA